MILICIKKTHFIYELYFIKNMYKKYENIVKKKENLDC